MKIDVKESLSGIKIFVEGDIEMTALKPFKDQLVEIGTNNNKNIELDFTGVEYIDSTGMGVILTLSKILKEKKKSLTISHCSEKIQRILQLSSLQDIL